MWYYRPMKLFATLLLACVFSFVEASAQRRPTASTAKRVDRGGSRVSEPMQVIEEPIAPPLDFPDCMDSYCKSPDFEDKGRCRCSANLPKIEMVLRNIEAVSRQADGLARNLEVQMNLGAGTQSELNETARLIGEIERNARGAAANRIDERTNVAEGPALHRHAMETCRAALPNDADRADNMQKAYNALMERDCGAYTTILKERADMVQQLLLQAQKNVELFATQEFRARNQLDPGACRLEFESCIRTECGEGMLMCDTLAAVNNAFTRCSIINENKCEDSRASILLEMRNLIEGELSAAGKKLR